MAALLYYDVFVPVAAGTVAGDEQLVYGAPDGGHRYGRGLDLSDNIRVWTEILGLDTRAPDMHTSAFPGGP